MRALTRVTGALAATAVLGTAGIAPALAADGDVDVVNTETVQVYLSPEGDVESRRVYEQLTMTGTGHVSLRNPVAGDGLRNIGGFGGHEVRDGQQLVEGDVEGSEQLRTVSEYDGKLPVSVTPTYRLDGKLIEPGDLVGRSGRLEVSFEVVNKTAETQEVTVDDGTGKQVTRSVEVPVPLVGSLTTVLPAGFTRVDPRGANSAGDGKGGTKLSYTMTLFPPIGSDTAVLTYAAEVRDAVVPRVDVTLLPVDPLQNPTFKSAANSYAGGADTGAELVSGAGEIDSNLLKLRDGAGELLAGLVQLSDGAGELEAGLAGKAGPGSKRLADGAGELKDGLGRLDEGAGQLRDGAGRLRDGAGDLADGTGSAAEGGRDLRDGLERISGGLSDLAEGLPAAPEGVQLLIGGVDRLLAGLGDPAVEGTLLNGLTQLEAGAGRLGGGLAQMRGSVQSQSGLAYAQAGVDQVQAGLADATKPGGSMDQLIGGLTLIKSLCPACVGLIDQQILPGVKASKTNLAMGSGALQQISSGLGGALVALDPANPDGLAGGAARLQAGLGDAVGGAGRIKTGTGQVRQGLVDLKTSLARAVTGVLRLNTGAGTAYDGSRDLADGLGRLDDGAGQLSLGAGQLAGGAGELASGAGTAKDGSGLLAAGALELATGLGDAVSGTGKLAAGLRKAADGAPALVDGAGRLSKEGMGALKQAGVETATDYGTLSATIKAASTRAKSDGMAYGAPEGARGLTAYSFVLTGADGEPTRNWIRGLAALGLLGLGGLVAMRRRLS